MAAPALALDTTKLGQGGSLFLDDLMTLVNQTPRLKNVIDERLAKLGQKPGDVRCTGMRFPGQWKFLGGERVSPYACQIGDEWLRITAAVKVTSGSGKVFEAITPEAMKSAKHVAETQLVWKWTKEAPEDN